ncbi:hypothetical protein AB0I77_44365 [Streptomyces sp. NPDC050619]|uniref:hypothetical protein n=1 Tax=Streptomyces sp. NPDC050619 TaxID=3157214 RepID=UPI0034251925
MAGVKSGAARPRGRTRWGLFAAVVALPVLALTGLVILVVAWSRMDYPLGGEPETVPCSEALDFGGARLPAGAQIVGACEEQGWQDIAYSATFRMPRADVRDWLTHTYPDAPAPETEFCADEDADLCLDLGYADHLPDTVDADAVQVNVVYEDADTALVRFSAFTV